MDGVDHAMVISNQPLVVVDHQVERRLTDLDTTRAPQLASIGPCSTTTVGTMTMLDVPVVYTVETSDCESMLTECQEALEAAPTDVATRYIYIRCLRRVDV